MRGQTRGQALIPVVFAVLILTALAVSFSATARREIRAADNYCEETRRELAAEGELQRTLATLADSSSNGATFGVLKPGSDVDANGWEPIGDDWVKVEAVDTASRIDLNGVSTATLSKLPSLRENPDVVAAIADWRSAGEQPSTGGAKSEVYRSLPTPYPAKDAPFDTIDELLLVRGVTPAILYGPPPSIQAPTSGNARQFDDLFRASMLPLSELLTTYVRERNLSTDGQPRVNINKASETDLREKLGLTVGQAQGILTYRNGQAGIVNLGESTATSGVQALNVEVETAPSSASSPNASSNASLLTELNTDVAVAGQGFKSVADLLEVPNFDRKTMIAITDRVAVNDEPYRYNVVNVNTASPEALATVQGMDRATLNAIVAARADGPFRTLGDLFRIQSISRRKFEAVVGHLCAKSSAYIVRIRVRSADTPTEFAATALIEMTDHGPRVLQWKSVNGSPGTSTWSPLGAPSPQSHRVP